MAARILETLLSGTWRNPQEVEESIHRHTEMLQLHRRL
jgi:hypothetical protein